MGYIKWKRNLDIVKIMKFICESCNLIIIQMTKGCWKNLEFKV